MPIRVGLIVAIATTLSLSLLQLPLHTSAKELSPKSLYSSSSDTPVAGSLLVSKKPSELIQSMKAKGYDVAELYKSKSGDSVLVSPELPMELRLSSVQKNSPQTKILPNYVYKMAFTPNDPNYPQQWNMGKISAPQAWDISRGDSTTTIAVIDTGILFGQTINGATYTQPDFPTGRMWTNSNETGMTQLGDACWSGVSEDKSTNDCDDDENGLVDDWRGWDFMGGWRGNDPSCPNHDDPLRYQHPDYPDYVLQDTDPQPYSCDSPEDTTVLNKNHYDGTCEAWSSSCFVGHGTMVGSVAAATADNGALVAGIDHNATIMNLRALDGYGYGTSAHIVSSINYAADHGADAINMSLAISCGNENFSDSAMENAMANAAASGIFIAAASGNDGLSNICYPASSQHTVSVGATDQNNKRQDYSNYSKKLDVVAPAGVPVANAPSAAINSNYYASAHGTSLATPHVVGLAALLKGNNSSLSTEEIKHIITYFTQRKISGMNGKRFHNEYGNGLINAHFALKYAALEHPQGTLIRNGSNPRVYLLENGSRRHIKSPAILYSHGYTWNDVKPATAGDMRLPEGQALDFRLGTLIKDNTNPVYVVNYAGGIIEKRHINSRKVFESLGYNYSDVLSVSTDALPATDGAVVSSTNHPQGTLVQSSGNPVYLLENGTRRHVKSPTVLYSNGYNWSNVKPATASDMNLPLSTALDFREGSLVQGSTNPVYVVNYISGTIEKRHITARYIFDTIYPSPQVFKVEDSNLPTSNGSAVD